MARPSCLYNVAIMKKLVVLGERTRLLLYRLHHVPVEQQLIGLAIELQVGSPDHAIFVCDYQSVRLLPLGEELFILLLHFFVAQTVTRQPALMNSIVVIARTHRRYR